MNEWEPAGSEQEHPETGSGSFDSRLKCSGETKVQTWPIARLSGHSKSRALRAPIGGMPVRNRCL